MGKHLASRGVCSMLFLLPVEGEEWHWMPQCQSARGLQQWWNQFKVLVWGQASERSLEKAVEGSKVLLWCRKQADLGLVWWGCPGVGKAGDDRAGWNYDCCLMCVFAFVWLYMDVSAMSSGSKIQLCFWSFHTLLFSKKRDPLRAFSCTEKART